MGRTMGSPELVVDESDDTFERYLAILKIRLSHGCDSPVIRHQIPVIAGRPF